MLELVDEDARAYQAFLEARHDAEVIAQVTRLPLRVAELCSEVNALGGEVRITGAIAGDVKAARTFATAAQAAALQLAEANVALQPNAEAKANLEGEIARLRP